jgi:hypothetical protein
VDETEASERLATAATAIVTGVEEALPGWVVREIDRIVDAWGRLDAAERVGAALRELFALDAAEQTSTPLQIVRTAYREPTAVLAAEAIPEVERDDFHERAWPDDRYGLVPESLADLGDEDLGPLLLAWGLAKAAVLRARVAGAGPGTEGRPNSAL